MLTPVAFYKSLINFDSDNAYTLPDGSKVVNFTQSGTYSFFVEGEGLVDILIVGAGSNGDLITSGDYGGRGGVGGDVIYQTNYFLSEGTYSVTIGAGGFFGGDTSISGPGLGLTASGAGLNGNSNAVYGYVISTGLTVAANGDGFNKATTSPYLPGAGFTSSITGVEIYYACGGGGGGKSTGNDGSYPNNSIYLNEEFGEGGDSLATTLNNPPYVSDGKNGVYGGGGGGNALKIYATGEVFYSNRGVGGNGVLVIRTK